MTDFNITKTAQAGTPKSSNQNEEAPVRMAEKSPMRNIAPITKFNTETGLLDVSEDSPWGQTSTDAAVEQAVEQVADDKKPFVNERHQKYLKDKEERAEAREAARYKKQAEQQALAKDLLRKGDIHNAAKSLGLSVQEMVALTNNALLAIPTPEEKKELTAEQNLAQEIATLKKEKDELKKQFESKSYRDTANSFIRENIDPILADKEKYELINAGGNNVNGIKQVIYEYMNKHYVDTTIYDSQGNVIKEGQVLNPADIAETIEQQMFDAAVQSAERGRQFKKLSKLYAAQEQEKQAEQDEEEAVKPARQVWQKTEPMQEPTIKNKQARPLDGRFPTRDPEVDDLTEEDLQAEENTSKKHVPLAVRKSSGKNLPFAFLSPEEKWARMKAGQ